jgi:hypothetical protein
MAMKVQYFGDVNDFRKFALLRTLSEAGRFRVGVCWMLTVADGSGHGDNRGYLRQVDQWRRYDPALFDALALAPAMPTIEDLRRVENEALIPDATFFNDLTPDALVERGAYHRACMNAFKACDSLSSTRQRARGEVRRQRAQEVEQVRLIWTRSTTTVPRAGRYCSTSIFRGMSPARPLLERRPAA